jgi:amidohydrolase
MATLVGLARLIARRPPAKGRVVLLFQPAEEDGSGAAAVIADPRFADIAPDWVFAVHNMPGVPRGQALIAPGAANCASAGLRLAFTGRTAHASQPEAGVSPAPALAALIPALRGLAQGIPPEPGFRMVTLTHLRMGEPAFGIAPGEGEIRATLRALDDVTLDAMIAAATDLAESTATLHGLGLDITLHDRFAACTNDAGAAGLFAQALAATGTTPRGDSLPFRASEDFGRFGTAGARAAMAFVGAGTDIPMLHNPDYDYPDDLIAPCVAAFDHILRHLTG